MTVATITSKICGHTFEKDLKYRNGNEIKRKDLLAKNIEFWSSRECVDCWKANLEIENEVIGEGLLTLTGSEKQVNWADKLRLQVLRKVDSHLENFFSNLENPSEELEELASKKVSLLRRVEEAKFWIEVREYTPEQVLKSVNLELNSVTTVWYANPKQIQTKYGVKWVGGNKPHYTEYALAN